MKKVRNIFQTSGLLLFHSKALTSVESTKTHHFLTKLPYEIPILRQIEWWEQNAYITKTSVLVENTLDFWYFFSVRTSYNELLSSAKDLNAHVCTFWSAGNLHDGAFLLYVSLI